MQKLGKMPNSFVLGFASLVRTSSFLHAGWLLLVIFPLTLWLTWSHSNDLLSSVTATLFMCSVGWMGVSALQLQREIKRQGLSGEGARALLSGSRPTDPDELRVWRWGWQFGYAVIAAIFFLILIVVVGLATGNGILG